MRIPRLAFTVLLFILMSVPAYANVLDTKINVNIKHESLSKVLRQIEQRTGIVFAYTTHAIRQDRLVTVQFSGIALGDLLKILLYDDAARFTAIDTQIIIFSQQNASAAKQLIAPVRDTVRISIADTVNIYDTVSFTVADTMRVYDTVLVKVPRRRDLRRKKDNFVALQCGYSSGSMGYSVEENPFLQMKSGQQKDFSAGIQLGQRAKFWEINTGAGISISRQQVPYTTISYHTQTITDSVAYLVKTVDSSYIALPGVDTSWFTFETSSLAYRYSTHQRTDSTAQSHEMNAHQMYLQIPIYVGFHTNFDKKMTARAGLGLVSNILLSSAREYSLGSEDRLATARTLPAYVSGYLLAGIGYAPAKSVELYLSAHTSAWITPPSSLLGISSRRTLRYGLQAGVRKYF